jgi:cell division protein FtsB
MNKLRASIGAVALLGAGLVLVIRVLPSLERRQQIERLKARNDELHRQLEALRAPAPPLPWEEDPTTREITDPDIRRRGLMLIKPGEKIFVVPLRTEPPQTRERKMTGPPDPPDGCKNVKIDHTGRVQMPADFSRFFRHLGYPTPAKPATKRRRQAADGSSSPKTAS